MDPGKLEPASEMQLLEIEKLTYKEVFKEEQLPDVLNLVQEDTGIRLALASRLR